MAMMRVYDCLGDPCNTICWNILIVWVLSLRQCNTNSNKHLVIPSHLIVLFLHCLNPVNFRLCTITKPHFCNSVWQVQFCPNPLTSFIGIFCLDVVFTSMNFTRFIIAQRNWNVMIYTAKRCCLILKALGTVQCSIFCYNYIRSTLLHVLYVIYESRERSEQSCQCLMIFEQSH